ncbi:MAG: cupin domain-containing protein [Candidatus Electronema sp. V4]|uniref:cupin domain-containing protein n=1 Tax=Candidatus Electronema sp. V4 TaxID=3454756 RepID=UPI004055392D
MTAIQVEKNPAEQRLQKLGVRSWAIWTKEVSSFPWHYDEQETCYFLEGSVVVTPENGEPVQIGKGDLVTFPEGMDCVWEIQEPVRKHYFFG